MTNIQKQKIGELRTAGVSYAVISETLGVSVNTIKSFVSRNKADKKSAVNNAPKGVCENCGKHIMPPVGKRQKRFCSDECRYTWWKNHRDKLARKAMYAAVCSCCGGTFESYGNQNRKFCSHKCYIKSRFGGAENDSRAV